MSQRAISMPEQFGPAAGDTLFAMNRASYLRTAGAVGADAAGDGGSIDTGVEQAADVNAP